MPIVAMEERPFAPARYIQVSSIDIHDGGTFGSLCEPDPDFVAAAVEDVADHGGDSRLELFRCTHCGDEVFVHVTRRPLARQARVAAYYQNIDGSMEVTPVPRELYRLYNAIEKGGIIADRADRNHRCG